MLVALPEVIVKYVRVYAVTSNQINLQLELFGSIVNGEGYRTVQFLHSYTSVSGFMCLQLHMCLLVDQSHS